MNTAKCKKKRGEKEVGVGGGIGGGGGGKEGGAF